MATRTDIDGETSVTQAIGPVSIATSTTTLSSAIDMTGKPGWRVLLITSVGTRTDGSFTPALVSSATSGGSYTAETKVSGSETAIAGANTTDTAAYLPTKPFIKAQITSSGVTSGALCSAVVVLVPPTL